MKINLITTDYKKIDYFCILKNEAIIRLESTIMDN